MLITLEVKWSTGLISPQYVRISQGLFLYTINHVGGKVIQRDITD